VPWYIKDISLSRVCVYYCVWRESRAFFGQMCYPVYTRTQLLTLVHVEGKGAR